MTSPSFFSTSLIEWYLSHRRDLPWRQTSDPYKIWISEIILQQTRVAQGLDYYCRFIERFPTVVDLAAADEQEVLTYWQGLGYYSRARNLHAAAKTVVNLYNKVFPQDYKTILSLKGIGEYTAAAITSFAWNMPHAVVDGNVYRVLSRFFGVDEAIDSTSGKKYFARLADEVMDKQQAGLYNQAIMEFGALQCVPTAAPDCAGCPLQEKCIARATNSIADLPVKQTKTKTQERYLYYFHVQQGDTFWLKRRQGKGIWQNLYEFPMIESETPLTFDELQAHASFRQWFPDQQTHTFRLRMENKKHILSHRVLYASFYHVTADQPSGLSEFTTLTPDRLHEYPIHRLMEMYLEQFGR